MKIFIKIIKVLGIAIVLLLVSAVLLRNELVIRMLHKEQANKASVPRSMLALPDPESTVYAALREDFATYAMAPDAYIIDELSKNDVVFVGENHRIAHDYTFIAHIIPDLYRNGIRDLALEFSLHTDSSLMKEVLYNPEYFDEEKVRQIMFNFSPYMGFKGILDIYRAAWEVNSRLPDEAEKFMIHGIMHPYDFSVLSRASDEENDSIMTLARGGVKDPEQFMANCIIEDFIQKGKKVLVYCGMHHAFSGYSGNGKRTGVIVKSSCPESKVITVSLHYPWPGKESFSSPAVYPVNGYIDTFIRTYADKHATFGINVVDNAFGDLTDTTSYYAHASALQLRDFCDGYIYLGPFSEITSVEILDRFINRKNFKQARAQLPNPELRDGLFRFLGPRVYNELVSFDSDLEIRYRHLY